MTYSLTRARAGGFFFAAIAGLFYVFNTAAQAQTQVTAFVQAVAEAAAKDADIAAFYKERGYKPIWTGRSDAARVKSFLAAAEAGDAHGLPVSSYDPEGLKAAFRAAKSERDRGRLEVEMSRVFLQYARDLQSGVLIPSKVDSGIVREIPVHSRLGLLRGFAKSSAKGYLKALAPKSRDYVQLMKQKAQMEKVLGRGGWGQRVQAKTLKPGESGAQVVQLRNRLIAMGYMRRSASQSYDANLQKAVQQFQLAHGLSADGVAGEGTIAEVNVEPEDRLKSIIVAMERMRWMNMELGKRHIWVNLTDFSAKIIDNGKVTFQTRSVVGKNSSDTRSPEFSDVMEFMVINPTWNVPRSIATKEYLPMLQKNPNAAGHLKLIDASGRTVSRGAVDFTQYTARTFPFALKQPPSDGNALGLVKFMFPNKHNIYLHDTPSKSLFNREVRAFSHGCIRLSDPFDFAYALLAKQTGDPKGLFHSHLKTGRESVVPLDQPVPVHLVYFTAYPTAKGQMNYRRDVYGRDAKLFSALSKAGVALRAVQG